MYKSEENIECLKNRLHKIEAKVESMSSYDLTDELLRAYSDFEDYLNKEDYIIWSKEAEDIAGKIYYIIKHEIIKRMEK